MNIELWNFVWNAWRRISPCRPACVCTVLFRHPIVFMGSKRQAAHIRYAIVRRRRRHRQFYLLFAFSSIRSLFIRFIWLNVVEPKNTTQAQSTHSAEVIYKNQISWIQIWFLYVFLVMRLFTPAAFTSSFFDSTRTVAWISLILIAYRGNKAVTDSPIRWENTYLSFGMLALVA